MASDSWSDRLGYANSQSHPNKPHLHVRIQQTPSQISASGGLSGTGTEHPLPSSSDGDATQAASSKETSSRDERHTVGKPRHSLKIPPRLPWIAANWTWSKWKPALRSAFAAWVSLIMFVIPSVESFLGQAPVLIIIASFLSPPSDPFVAVLERESIILLFVSLAWAWLCLGLKFADLARTNHVPDATVTSFATGQYLEIAPSIVVSVFVFFGSVFYSYVKARQGPGPYLFACILGFLAMDISFTTAALSPYPYYEIGQAIMLPIVFHSAVALLTSILIFPSSLSALFTTRLQSVLSPLTEAIKQHRERLAADITSPDFSATSITVMINKAEGELTLLAAASRLLRLDVIYCRIAPTDYGKIHELTRRLVVRANGMSLYYTLIDPTRERFPVTPAPSVPGTPSADSPSHSRSRSPDLSHRPTHEAKQSTSTGTHSKYRRHHRSSSRTHTPSSFHRHHPNKHGSHYYHHHHYNILHNSLLHLSLSRTSRTESVVGVFESHRYLNLEATHLSHPDSERYTARATELLSASCQDLLRVCESAMLESCNWLVHLRDHRFNFWMSAEEKDKIREDRVQKFEGLLHQLSQETTEFTNKKRLCVLEPYSVMFESVSDSVTYDDIPPHRYLFHCYVYQYHLMLFSASLQAMLEEIIRLDKERKRPKLWLPSLRISGLAFWSIWEPSEEVENDDDENPETIPGINPAAMDLGQAVRRDPDALPPRNTTEAVMNRLYSMVVGLGRGNALFALKAGVLSVLLILPTLLKSSADFAYANKFVWAVFMAQTTLARFHGDTVFGIVTRIFSTFVGGLLGTTMWYISAGSGRGNPFGLAAVCFTCFPLFFFVRLYSPMAPMTSIIMFVTAGLVIGYSYQDTHLVNTTSTWWGIDVAWRRFTLVSIGLVCAGIFSFFPPSTTIRSYQRRVLATTSAELGTIYCSVVSFVSTRREDDITLVVQSLLAIRSKLKRSLVMKANVMYEFSLRGRWPAKRYHKILEIQLELSYLLSHLLSVVEQLEPVWAQAFLKRTRLLDSDFQGDVLAVISLVSSSLRNGSPLPQVSPCPLLDRFMERPHGFNVIHQEEEEDLGLPKNLTLDTLESLQYLTFCVGVCTAFSIMSRLDRLMIATKELVGEQYHIDGVGLPLHQIRRPTGIELRTPTLSLRQGQV